jgi:hypothetical protein
MFEYQFENLLPVLSGLISSHANPGGWEWLTEQAANDLPGHLPMTFGMIPRKLGRALVVAQNDQLAEIYGSRPGFEISGWTVDRLARVWLLLQLPADDQAEYHRHTDNLFSAADSNELVALYSALPVLPYPESWVDRCTEGIRSNIADVQQAIMCNNPYAEENLNESAWNQLVLKAFFTDKPIDQITGLDKRTNFHLAVTLSDYAHERWAAHRSVNPQLWRCMGLFLNQDLFADILVLEKSTNPVELEAAALACSASSYPEAHQWLDNHKNLKAAIESGELTWKSVAHKSPEYVLQQ